MTSRWFCAVKLHTLRWLYSLTYERGTISKIQRRKYAPIVNIKNWINNIDNMCISGVEFSSVLFVPKRERRESYQMKKEEI